MKDEGRVEVLVSAHSSLTFRIWTRANFLVVSFAR